MILEEDEESVGGLCINILNPSRDISSLLKAVPQNLHPKSLPLQTLFYPSTQTFNFALYKPPICTETALALPADVLAATGALAAL